MRLRYLILALLCLPVWGQSSANILAAGRSIDWSSAGVTGGIPSASWTKSGSTIAACGSSGARVSPATCGITAALAGCGTNHFVLLGNGTFWLNTSGISIPSNCELRGGGANNTILDFAANSAWYWGSCDICFLGNYDSASDNGSPPGFGGCAGTCTQISWTGTAGSAGTYTKGATVIDLNATATGLSAGMMLQLVQNDDTALANSYPVCSAVGINCSLEGSGFNIHGTAQRQNVKVVSVSGSGTSTQATISPGLFNDNWRTGQTPIAYYQACCNVTNAGVSALTVKDSFNGQMWAPIAFFMADNDWATGVVSLPFNAGVGSGGGARDGILMELTDKITVQSSWCGPAFGGGQGSTTTYCIEMEGATSTLILNNIFFNDESPTMEVDGVSGTVVAFNYAPPCSGAVCTSGDTGLAHHGAGTQWNLYEGNVTDIIRSDDFHGTEDFNAINRNAVGGTTQDAIQEMALNRYTNAIGNVIFPTSPAFYQCLASNNAASCGRFNGLPFWIGYCQATSSCPFTGGGGGVVAYDTLSPTYLMRWGNWDNFTNAIRWCGNSSDTGWSSTCGSTSEVPTGIGTYPNSVPTVGDTGAGQSVMQNSFFLTATTASSCGTGLSWWKTPATPACEPFPPIGPDVFSGSITGTGGHANPIPAEDAYNFISGNSANFNAATLFLPDTGTAATPTFSPGAGTYTGPQSVTITTTSPGAIICYNTTGAPATNGTTGCTTGTLYSGAVTVSTTETLFAVAGGTGYSSDSSVGSAAYTINASPSNHLLSGGITISGGVVVK